MILLIWLVTPKILWITCGNVTNRNQILTAIFPDALERLPQGKAIIEISPDA
ncbi:hypothetical protein [Nostoc sp.]|uniref:hypothetical protein n=1 Tax=Nostoc sp. TaxID=1180 RepID=UPI002FF3AB55